MEAETQSDIHSGHAPDGWRTVAIITWIAVFGALAVVAISSRTIGRSIWWLGNNSNPAPWFYILAPIALVVIPIESAITRSRHMPLVSVVCSLGIIASALPDLSRTPAIAIGVVMVGIAALTESIALVVVARQYR